MIGFNVFGAGIIASPFLLRPTSAHLEPSIRLSGIVSLFCFYMSARTESEYDILKYGDGYRECMRGVSMWNIARGIIKERGWDME